MSLCPTAEFGPNEYDNSKLPNSQAIIAGLQLLHGNYVCGGRSTRSWRWCKGLLDLVGQLRYEYVSLLFVIKNPQILMEVSLKERKMV